MVDKALDEELKKFIETNKEKIIVIFLRKIIVQETKLNLYRYLKVKYRSILELKSKKRLRRKKR